MISTSEARKRNIEIENVYKPKVLDQGFLAPKTGDTATYQISTNYFEGTMFASPKETRQYETEPVISGDFSEWHCSHIELPNGSIAEILYLSCIDNLSYDGEQDLDAWRNFIKEEAIYPNPNYMFPDTANTKALSESHNHRITGIEHLLPYLLSTLSQQTETYNPLVSIHGFDHSTTQMAIRSLLNEILKKQMQARWDNIFSHSYTLAQHKRHTLNRWINGSYLNTIIIRTSDFLHIGIDRTFADTYAVLTDDLFPLSPYYFTYDVNSHLDASHPEGNPPGMYEEKIADTMLHTLATGDRISPIRPQPQVLTLKPINQHNFIYSTDGGFNPTRERLSPRELHTRFVKFWRSYFANGEPALLRPNYNKGYGDDFNCGNIQITSPSIG